MPAPLSDLEVLALAAVLRLGPQAYGVSIRDEIAARTGREVSVGSLYKALARLEARGHLTPFTGEPTAVRGGRAKKHFKMEPAGRSALERELQALSRMVDGLGLDWSAP
ncbi:MAG: PadR family transcriptional regulator [Gemmatimonadetes bacterium]|nr:PadR family transcriptional regulator [Gemmatimonadota bacterium]